MLKREYTLVKKEKKALLQYKCSGSVSFTQGCLLPPLGLLETLPPLCISPPLLSPLFLILAKEYQAAFNSGGQCLVGVMSSGAELGLSWTL